MSIWLFVFIRGHLTDHIQALGDGELLKEWCWKGKWAKGKPSGIMSLNSQQNLHGRVTTPSNSVCVLKATQTPAWPLHQDMEMPMAQAHKLCKEPDFPALSALLSPHKEGAWCSHQQCHPQSDNCGCMALPVCFHPMERAPWKPWAWHSAWDTLLWLQFPKKRQDLQRATLSTDHAQAFPSPHPDVPQVVLPLGRKLCAGRRPWCGFWFCSHVLFQQRA